MSRHLPLPSSKPPSLKWPRRDARRVNNPPAHRWARACRIRPVPNPSLPFPTSPRISLRGNPLHLVFFDFFLVSNFSFQNPSQSLSKGPPWDPKITKNLIFSFQNRPKDHPFVRFSVDLCFYHFLDDFLVIFSGKNDTKNDASFHSGAFFFGTADPYDSMVFTIRKLLFQFWPF